MTLNDIICSQCGKHRASTSFPFVDLGNGKYLCLQCEHGLHLDNEAQQRDRDAIASDWQERSVK